MAINLGPIIPDRPTPAKPAAPVARYIPAYANDQARAKQEAINQAAIKQGLVPKPTQTTKAPAPSTDSKSSSSTGSIEKEVVSTGDKTGTKASKPLGVSLAQQAIQRAQKAAKALQTFQINQANAQLTKALANIDRAALEGYKGMANDYAARGMSASGAYATKALQATKDTTQAKLDADQAVKDFIQELKLTGNLEQAQANLARNQAFQDYINSTVNAGLGG